MTKTMGMEIANILEHYFGPLILFLVVNNNIPVSCNGADSAESYLFVFGDSLFDPGNNVRFDTRLPSAKCPYGMTYFNQATGRLSDGLILPDFIARKLGIPFAPPVLDENANFSYGANFASAGSGVFDNHPNCMNFETQFEKFVYVVEKWYEQLGEDEAKRRLTKAIYLISMGGNDYFAHTTGAPDATFRQEQVYVKQVISELSKVIKNMYKLGARKFVFQNVGPLGCIPFFRSFAFKLSEGCAAPPLTLATLHNNALYDMAESIQNSPEYSEFLYSIYDLYTFLEDRIRSPHDYGFKYGGRECYRRNGEWRPLPRGYNCTDSSGTNSEFDGELCSDPSEHVFFDDGHNTDEFNRQLSELVWTGGPDFVYPYNLEQLVQLDPTAAKNVVVE